MNAIAIDTSAIVEMLLNGRQAAEVRGRFDAADLVQATTSAKVETAFVLIGRLAWSRAAFDRAWSALGLAEVAVDAKIGDGAIDAFETWGKGRHAAGLNFGDCLSYALARTRGLPLLFVGDDFARTDVERA